MEIYYERKIFFDADTKTNDYVLITRCPYHPDPADLRMVGSRMCQMCKNFISHDHANNCISCSHE